MAEKRKRDLKDQGGPAASLKRPNSETDKGTALGLGINCFGQVGVGVQYTERKKPQVCKQMPPVVSLAAGGMHSVAVTTDGRLFSWGCNDEGCLGRTASDDDAYCLPGEAAVEGSPTFVACCAGDSHSAALTDDGCVFACGCFRDSSGKLGFNADAENQRTFTCIYNPEPETRRQVADPAVQISSGSDHFLILLESGKVLSLGTAEQGQLGRVGQRFSSRDSARERGNSSVDLAKRRTTVETMDRFLKPHRVTGRGLRKVVRVGTGAWSSYFVDDKGQTWACGLNNYGQLGVDSGSDTAVYNVRRAAEWKPAEPIAMVEGGGHHAVSVNQKGEVYAVGRGDCGQLGLGSTEETQAVAKVETPSSNPIVEVACGSSCSFAVSAAGEGFAWGFGENLQLTTGSEDDALAPVPMAGKQLETRTVSHVSSGGQHTLMIAADK